MEIPLLSTEIEFTLEGEAFTESSIDENGFICTIRNGPDGNIFQGECGTPDDPTANPFQGDYQGFDEDDLSIVPGLLYFYGESFCPILVENVFIMIQIHHRYYLDN